MTVHYLRKTCVRRLLRDERCQTLTLGRRLCLAIRAAPGCDWAGVVLDLVPNGVHWAKAFTQSRLSLWLCYLDIASWIDV